MAPDQSQDELDVLVDDLCAKAVEIAKAFGKPLDYSPESIAVVEAILGKLHERYVQTQSSDGYRGIAFEFGVYISRVIDRNFPGGRLRRDHSMFGANTFPYEWNGGEIFPVAWCEKRLLDGPADDVVAKFRTLVADESCSGSVPDA